MVTKKKTMPVIFEPPCISTRLQQNHQPCLRPGSYKNVSLKWRHVISLPGVPTCLGSALCGFSTCFYQLSLSPCLSTSVIYDIRVSTYLLASSSLSSLQTYIVFFLDYLSVHTCLSMVVLVLTFGVRAL